MCGSCGERWSYAIGEHGNVLIPAPARWGKYVMGSVMFNIQCLNFELILASSTGELKQAIVSMMLRKDEMEENNR